MRPEPATRIDDELLWYRGKLIAVGAETRGFRLKNDCLHDVLIWLRALFARARAIASAGGIGWRQSPHLDILERDLTYFGGAVRGALLAGADYAGGYAALGAVTLDAVMARSKANIPGDKEDLRRLQLVASAAERVESQYGRLAPSAPIERPALAFDMGQGRIMRFDRNGARIDGQARITPTIPCKEEAGR